jgi:putative tryptophan/tyrosine transport system permease protein
VEFLETGDMKLITAVIVIGALILPKLIQQQKEKQRKRRRMAEAKKTNAYGKSGEQFAAIKSDS